MQLPANARYAAIFVSRRSPTEDLEYSKTAARMEKLARLQPGFVHMESVREGEGLGITVSFWESEEAIRNWAANEEHLVAQKKGKDRWYDWYHLSIARVDRHWGFRRLSEDKAKDVQRNDQQHQPDDKK